MTNRKFDRVPSNDTRNENYPVRLMWATAEPPIVDKYWEDYARLDQGPDGACVGFGVSGELAAAPEIVPDINYNFAMQVYRDAKVIDEWEGEDYEGTSVLAGVKVARNRGYYTSYLWATTEEDMARTVANYGPVVIGVDWFEGMMDPDSKGFLHPTGRVVGGHCVVVIGISAAGGYYVIRNSWGPSWGSNGEAKISRSDMALLMSRNGDVCKPVRVHIEPDVDPEPAPIPIDPEPTIKPCGFFSKLWHWITTLRWECP